MRILDILNYAKGELYNSKIETYILDSEILLGYCLNVNKSFLYANYDNMISDEKLDSFLKLIERRKRHEPIAYILGKKEFYGFDFIVNKDVLIPRPETEHMVEYLIKKLPYDSSMLDTCTGSGCIPISVKYHRPDISVCFSDISKQALKIALKNYKRLIKTDNPQIIKSNLFNSIPDTLQIDCITANPPYIKHEDLYSLPLDIIRYEPLLALDGGEDGLYFYMKILDKAHIYLKDRGILVLETDNYSLVKIKNYIKRKYLDRHWIIKDVLKDYSNIDRIMVLEKQS